jgi:hypothetical protein
MLQRTIHPRATVRHGGRRVETGVSSEKLFSIKTALTEAEAAKRDGDKVKAQTHPCHICTGTAPTPATSAPGLRSPLPHLQQDRARPSHICTGAAPTAPTSAPGLGRTLPHLHQDCAHRTHICTGTGPTAPTSAPGLGPPLPQLVRAEITQIALHTETETFHICAGIRRDETAWLPCVSLRSVAA